ncbi:portal protein [Mycobacterium phage MS810]|uniref:portal protein n=1 Tax=Mycobacterium phage Gardann TaxID=1873696 RepID=UPI0008111E0F|nr:portal protein [Mycobacterium phage Gardann]ANU79126.1 portal protein [Mycobacterium phage Gardann]AOT22996.1 portal protein [Mycobacterium phage Wilder]ASR87389.1 portal protein [Mycobacterium phage Nicholasp3]QGJ96316.1 portal protein [Mycobacterium phage Kahlid]
MAIELPEEISDGDVRKFVENELWPEFIRRREKLDKIANWARGEQPDYLIQNANREKRALLKLAKTPWLGLVVTHFTQALFVDGYRAEGSKENAKGPWQTWNANNMQSRQIAIHRAALTYGYAYARVLPGEAWDGKNQAEIRGVSPRRLLALYEDQINDEYPRYALELAANGKSVRLYTDEFYYELKMPSPGSFPNEQTIKKVRHGVGVCPFVRYVNMMDLDGFTMGEVEYLVPVASKIDKTDYDRLLAQHYNSWKVKVATGIDDLSEDATPEEQQRAKLILAQDDILMHGNEHAKFYTLPETSLDGFIAAHTQDVEILANNAQVPVWILNGQLANLSADALTAATKGTIQKLYERQVTFGSAHNQLLRLAAHVEGDAAGARDFTASVSWQDTSVRSLAQAVDAYGKAATMLGMPKEFLWGLIPGITKTDVETMREHFNDDDEMTQMLLWWTANGPGGEFAAEIEVDTQKRVIEAQGDVQKALQEAQAKAQKDLAKQNAEAQRKQAVEVAKATPAQPAGGSAPTARKTSSTSKRTPKKSGGVNGNDPASRAA